MWGSPSRWTTKLSACSTPPADPPSFVTENEMVGGSIETEATLEAVRPTGPSGVAAVMRATPAGWPRNALLKSSTSSATVCILLVFGAGATAPPGGGFAFPGGCLLGLC